MKALTIQERQNLPRTHPYAWRLGRIFKLNGRPLESNPFHKVATRLHWAFIEGWLSASI